MDADERELLDKAVRHALAAAAEADDALEDLGWRDALASDPRDAVSVLFTALGDLNANSSSLDDVMLDGFGVGEEPTFRAASVALPAFNEWDGPGVDDDGVLAIDGLALPRVTRRDAVVVPSRARGGLVLATVPTDGLERTTIAGLDPSLGLERILATELRPLATRPLDPSAWAEGVAGARRALASQLLALGRAMLRLAREHALEREQFGRPIAHFQAVRHRLAEAYVALEAADAAVVSAWDASGSVTAILAKSLAGRATRVAATHCQQVLAGIGFTTEHPLHRYVKRAAVLDGLLGSSSRLSRHVGTTLLETRYVPRLLDL